MKNKFFKFFGLASLLVLLLAVGLNIEPSQAQGDDSPKIDQVVEKVNQAPQAVFVQNEIDGEGETTTTEAADQVTDDQVTGDEVPTESFWARMWKWLQTNGAAFLVAIGAFLQFMDIIVRLTPTEKDNAALKWLQNLYDRLVPNLKKGGGTHTV